MAGMDSGRTRKPASQSFADYFAALLNSPQFQTSPRRNELLRYLVDKSLSGQGKSLSEYAIALEVFRKPESFDQRIDSTVRSEISRLRKFVSRYYLGPGAQDPWRIVFPARGYVPQILPAGQSPLVPRNAQTHWRLRGGVLALLSAAAAVLAALAAVTAVRAHHGANAAARQPGADRVPGDVRSRPENPEAQALYLKGQYYWEHRTEGGLRDAVDAYTQAIVADSNYAQAYAGLAASYDLMPEYSSMPQQEAFSRAIAAAHKAVSLDPRLSIAHRALAFGLFWSQTDIPGALHEFQVAIRLAPNDAEAHHWYATALNSVLRETEARNEIDTAQQLDPGSRSILADQAWIRYSAGDAQAAQKLHELEIAEPDFRGPPEFLARIDLGRGNYIDYLGQLQRLAKISNSLSEIRFSLAARNGWKNGGKVGMLRAMKAIQEQAFSSSQSDGYDLARTCALLGEKPQAVEYLQNAFSAKDIFVLDTLRPDWASPMNGYPPFENFRAQIRNRFGIGRA